VSPKWAPALTTSHGLAVRIKALYNGSVVADDIPFVDGSVTVDRGSETRRSLSLSVAEPWMFPTNETDRYGVYGQQLYVERGIRYMDGSTEMVPLGTFVITSVSGNIHTGPLNIVAAGQEIILKRALFETAASTKGLLNAAAFINFHIGDTIPGASFVDRSTTGTSALATKTFEGGTDKWAALVEVANSVGGELFCDAYGTFVLADIPDPMDPYPPVAWEVNAGEGGVMVSADMETSANEVYNRVVVSGENAEDNKPPVSATATITDGADPLRYGGPYGKVTKTYSSSLITTSGQANTTAIALLRRYRAANRSVKLASVPNPALDAGDWLRVDYGPSRLPELHMVQSFDVPLTTNGGASAIATIGGRTIWGMV
jgi:hypothetical protein